MTDEFSMDAPTLEKIKSSMSYDQDAWDDYDNENGDEEEKFDEADIPQAPASIYYDGFKAFHEDDLRKVFQQRIEREAETYGDTGADTVVFMGLQLSWNFSKIENYWFDLAEPKKVQMGIFVSLAIFYYVLIFVYFLKCIQEIRSLD